MLSVLRKCLYLLRQENPVKWLLVLFLAVIVTCVETLGALLVFVLISLVAAPDSSIDLPIFGSAKALSGEMPHEDFAVLVAAGVAVFFLIRGILVVGQIYVADRVAYHAGARLSVRLMSGYLSMPYLLHLRRNSAELIRNTYESVRAVTSEVIRPVVSLLGNAVLAIGLVGVLLATAPQATLLACLFLGPIILLLLRVIQPRMKALGRERQQVMRGSLKVLQQSLHGVRELKLFGRAPFFVREFRTRQQTAARIGYHNRVMQEVPVVMVETAIVVFIAVFFITILLTQGSAQEGLAVLGLFAYAALRLQPSIHKTTKCLNSIKFAAAAIDNIYHDLRSIESSATPKRLPESGMPPRQRELVTGVRLENVEFRYSEDAEPVLRGIDFTIHPGESIGIVGPTGGGKSTLVDLITGLLEPTTGRVLIDDVELRNCTADWQRRLGVVSQNVFLIDDTIRRNIALGITDDQIDEDCVDRAIDLAQLSAFVKSLPKGLDTMVGERGVRLSGGQRQRLAIARALYREPAVLVFDEGTSALDNLTEAEFLHALDRLQGSRTIITVAHRLTTVLNCDRILLVEDGRITDIGKYGELITRSGRFRSMAVSGVVAER